MLLQTASDLAMTDDAPTSGPTDGDASCPDESLYLLGEPELDHHHDRLFHCLKQLVAASGRRAGREPVAAAAGDLFETWIAHCDAEKGLMHASGWRERARHLADHNRLTLALSNLLYRHVRADREVKLEQMAKFFICYLVEHLHRFDRPLAAYLLERRQVESGEPALSAAVEAE